MKKKLEKKIIKSHYSLWNRNNIKKITKKGRYDVWFTLINDIERGEAYWIRYTLLCPKTTYIPDESKSLDENIDAMKGGRCTLWFGYFKAGNSADNFMVKKIYPLSQVEVSQSLAGSNYSFIKIGDSELTLKYLKGNFETQSGKKVAWDLQLSHYVDPFFPIPIIGKILGITTTIVNSTHPKLFISGSITVDEQKKEIFNVPSNQMHTYGLEYVDEKIWMHCHSFKDDPEAWFEFGYKDGKGTLGFFDGTQLYSLNKLSSMKNFKISDSGPEKLTMSIEHKGVEITCKVDVPRESLIGLTYRGPNDTVGYCYNCELANLTLTLTLKDSEGKTTMEKDFRCEQSLSWETHWLKPIEGLKLLDWDDEFI